MLMVTLRTPQGKKEYAQDFVSGRMFRKTVAMKKEFANGVNEETLDKMVVFVTELFGNQFTIDEFYDGIAADKLMSTIIDCINAVVGKIAVSADGEQSPN